MGCGWLLGTKARLPLVHQPRQIFIWPLELLQNALCDPFLPANRPFFPVSPRAVVVVLYEHPQQTSHTLPVLRRPPGTSPADANLMLQGFNAI